MEITSSHGTILVNKVSVVGFQSRSWCSALWAFRPCPRRQALPVWFHRIWPQALLVCCVLLSRKAMGDNLCCWAINSCSWLWALDGVPYCVSGGVSAVGGASRCVLWHTACPSCAQPESTKKTSSAGQQCKGSCHFSGVWEECSWRFWLSVRVQGSCLGESSKGASEKPQ